MPCAILDDADDAAAVEASLIENIARLDADEVTQWATFTRLIKEGRTPGDIAGTFGLPDLTVRRVLALGNLLPRIRHLYAAEKIERATVRHLTMATKSQQREWLALFDDPQRSCPTGHQLKAWLFGGQSINAGHALFDLGESGLGTVADLFGEERYVADAEAFWTLQNAAIDARRAAYLAAGWVEAIVVPPHEHFAAWEYEKTAKRKGGRVYIDVRASGEVVFHEGYVSRREAARLARAGSDGASAKPARPELTSGLQTYIDIHRHAAVRADLLAAPGVALRLMVAHAITGSALWSVRPQSQACRDDATAESVENGSAEAAFDAERRMVLALLGMDADEPTVTGGNADAYGLVGVFGRLIDCPDHAVMAVVGIVMGETLASGSAVVEAVGLHLGTDMAQHWQADDAFFALIRDKEVTNALLAEVAGSAIADANRDEKAKGQKAIIRDCLAGSNGRAEVAGWVPRWMAFPPAAYTTRGGVGTVRANALALAALEPDADGGDAPDDTASGAGEGDRAGEDAPLATDDGAIRASIGDNEIAVAVATPQPLAA